MIKDIKKLVVKHNKLIEFKGRMSTNELKLFSLIIADSCTNIKIKDIIPKKFSQSFIELLVNTEVVAERIYSTIISNVHDIEESF